ncbi:MAG: ferredoxin reductase [Caulobacterales bacterium 32-69-10]|nr:MAG: ferredoxin reductase [Caulobacterales bacterium 32-69-10]
MSDERAVIIGAGHAGGSVAAHLRQYGWSGPIVLIGDEPIAPYQRPPLSKAWLKGEATAEDLGLRGDGFWDEEGIELRLDVHVSCIDTIGKRVKLASGEFVPYDKLILATGARARKLALPGAELDGVLSLRTAADAEVLKNRLGPGRKLAVVGGGYIGLEAAASARALGADVVVVEREPRLLARVACSPLSEFFLTCHRRHGVTFALGADLAAIEGVDGRVTGLSFFNGDPIACDTVLIGVGAIPNDELAREAGLDCDNGILVDLAARTSDPDIYAIGDCTRRPLPIYGSMGRLESVPNALEQAKQAACDLTGKSPPPGEVPWFWSDQYDLKLQIAGLPLNADQLVIRGEPRFGHFAVFHLGPDQRIQCVEAVNSPAEFMGGRLLIASRKPVAPERLRDISIPMKQVAGA